MTRSTLHRCAGAHCPGLPWRASEVAHPAQCVYGAAPNGPPDPLRAARDADADADANAGVCRWLVVWKCETDPTEVYPFAVAADAETFYEEAAVNWSEVYLVEVLRGPGVTRAR